MKHLLSTLFIAFILCAVVACDKAPDGVIPESKMEKIVVDLSLADAYIESHFDQFQDDSSRLVLKQSVFAKYGVTPELYDTSLVWYARNMDVYIKVYDNAIARLQDMQSQADNGGGAAEASKGPQMGGQQPVAQHKFSARGDSADVWTGPRRWVFTPGMRKGFITFDFDPDEESRNGDRYELMLKANPMRSTFKVMLATDYNDGSTVYVNRQSCNDGWNTLTLQTDSTRKATRIYGYINYDILPGDIAYVDSLTVLRTHASRETYSAVWGHKVVERIKRETAEPLVPKPDEPAATKPSVPSVTSQPQGHFKPKEGVNKSSAQRHITQSPNASHLPSTKQR